MDLHALDILLIMHEFEPSRIKMWELVRRYDPVQVATLLYLLENVQSERGRFPKTLPIEDLYKRNNAISCSSKNVIRLSAKPALRVDRVESEHIVAFGNPRADSAVARVSVSDLGENIIDILGRVRTPEQYANVPGPDNLTKLVVHNLGTKEYKSFLDAVKFLLFNDIFQDSRSEIRYNDTVASKYLSWCLLFSFTVYPIDSSSFRYVIVPRAQRIYEAPNFEYLAEPLYQGFRLTVNHDLEDGFRYFNRFGENMKIPIKVTGDKLCCLINNKMYPVSCTFEAVLMPLDIKNRLRSWRYWKHRAGYVFFITDVYRVGDELLINVPFSKRALYIENLKHPMFHSSEITNDASKLLVKYSKCRDMYWPYTGVVYRRVESFPINEPYEFKFNVQVMYNPITNNLVSLGTQTDLDKLRNTDQYYFDFEMADKKIIRLVYSHTPLVYHLCEYNHTIHQFEHTTSVERLPYDVHEPIYKPETIVVVNAKERPRGILFVRFYFDKHGGYIGYENKFTQSQYDVP